MAQSEEKRREQSERMKAHWAAKRASQNKNPETKDIGEVLRENNQTFDDPVVSTPQPKEDTIIQPDIGDLIRQIQELKDTQWQLMRGQIQSQSQDTAVSNGKLTGTIERYAVDPGLYPDPRERLSVEPRLARFAFSMNYELQWNIGESSYETIDHIRMKEPKFTLTLVRIMLDEDTGEPTNGRYDICRLIMHEDPTAALTIAREQGLDVSTIEEADFLNEMRYIRMRDWLLEAFYPSKPTISNQKRDMVINGKLVSYWEKNAEVADDTGTKKIDWDSIPKTKF